MSPQLRSIRQRRLAPWLLTAPLVFALFGGAHAPELAAETALMKQGPGEAPAPRTDTIPGPDSTVVPGQVLAPDTIPPARPIPAPDTIPRDGSLPAEGPIQLEGVTVDILRSPMSLESVPFAVSVLSDELGRTGRSGASIEEALHGLPGVQVQNRFNHAVGERITIRGFGARSPFGVRGVAIVVDGVPATLPDGQSTLDHLDLGTLGRVEALRGPGSAHYGNAAGGVLIFETRAPSPSPFRQEVQRVSGAHGLERLQSTTSGTVGGGGYLVNLARYEIDGFRTTEGGAEPGVPSLYGKATRDQFNAQLSAPLQRGTVRVSANALSLEAEDPGALDRDLMLLEDRRAMPLHVLQRAGKTVHQAQLGIGWDGPVGERDLDLMVHGIRRTVANPAPSGVMDLDRHAFGLRAIVRSEHVGEGGRLWWSIGGETGFQFDDRRNFRNFSGMRGERTLDQSETVTGQAVFLQAMLPINPILNVLTGLRYDRIRFSASDHLGETEDRPDASGARTLDSASPSFGVHAGFDPALSTYLNLSTAFETPTTTELATSPDGTGGFNPDLEPQVGFTIEVGARGVLGPVMAYEAAYFHTTLHGELLAFELEEQPGVSFFRNSGRSVRQGIELAAQLAPSPVWNARVTYATNHARFREYDVNGESLSGNRVPGLIPWRLEALFRVGPGDWFVEYRHEWTAAVPGNDWNDPEARSPSYQLSDIRFGANEVNLLGLRLSPFGGVTNAYDQYYNTSVVVNAAGGRYFEPGPGRTVYLGGSAAVQW